MAFQNKRDRVRVALIGLGFIGASIGLRLRPQGEWEIVGHDRDFARAQRARQMGALDRADWNLPRTCEGADVVILALPLNELRGVLEAIATSLSPGCLVTDTAPLKQAPLEWARAVLPPSVAFVGGYPIVQTSGQGLEAARADLFEGTLYCLTPAADVDPAAVQMAAHLAQALGAEPYYLDADEHDGLAAAVEQLPGLLAASLLWATAQSPGWKELNHLAGTDFGQITALVEEDPALYRALCLANSQAVAHWLGVYRRVLAELQARIEARDEEALVKFFEQVSRARADWLRVRAQGFPPCPPMLGGAGGEPPAVLPPRPGLLSRLLGTWGRVPR